MCQAKRCAEVSGAPRLAVCGDKRFPEISGVSG